MRAICLILLLVLLSTAYPARAQTAPTPIPLVLPTLAPTPTPDTATPIPTSGNAASGVVVQALDATSGANVRGSPDLSSTANILGKIKTGTYFQVIGQYQKWFEILYTFPGTTETVPAWVYNAVVQTTGDLRTVPQVDPANVPTANAAALAQSTAAFLTTTPGAPGSATALKGSATGISTLNPAGQATPTPGGLLPTFTYPPPLAEATLAPRTTVSASQGNLPPIVPIIGLAAVGLLGLLISVLRR